MRPCIAGNDSTTDTYSRPANSSLAVFRFLFLETLRMLIAAVSSMFLMCDARRGLPVLHVLARCSRYSWIRPAVTSGRYFSPRKGRIREFRLSLCCRSQFGPRCSAVRIAASLRNLAAASSNFFPLFLGASRIPAWALPRRPRYRSSANSLAWARLSGFGLAGFLQFRHETRAALQDEYDTGIGHEILSRLCPAGGTARSSRR